MERQHQVIRFATMPGPDCYKVIFNQGATLWEIRSVRRSPEEVGELVGQLTCVPGDPSKFEAHNAKDGYSLERLVAIKEASKLVSGPGGPH
jgi:hypothetical protein